MRNRFFTRSVGPIFIAVLAIVVAAYKAPSQQGGGGRLDGTWEVQLTVRNCQTGAAIVTFPEVTTFMFGGTMIDSTAGRAPALKTLGQGVWSHVSDNVYQFKFKHFNFDAAGNFIGWSIISQEATLDSDGSQYSSEGKAETYNSMGTLLATGCSTTTATRLQ